jgi:hypothetical protein
LDPQSEMVECQYQDLAEDPDVGDEIFFDIEDLK